MENLKQQTSRSVIWSAVERFSVQGIQLILTVIIARVLLPSDYGLIAMLSIFMALAQTFIDSGFANALIQKKERTAKDYSTAFYFNIGISIILYLVLFLCSPYIADFYNEPKLDYITKVFGITLIISSFGIAQQAKLTVELNFKRQAHASIIAVIFSGAIGVWMAYNGFGVWALVWQSLLNNLLRVIFLWIYSKWIPSLEFSKSSFTSLFSFGSKMLGSSLLHTIYVNLYTLIIGKFFAADICGLYNQANKLSSFPSSNLATVIVRAVYPIQCRYQDDLPMLKDLYLKYLRMACFIIFPIMILFCILAEPLVILFLKEQWLPAVPLLQLLCLAYMWDPVMKINGSMVTVKGRSDYFLKAEIYKKIVAFIILFATIPFGITAMCAGLIAYSFADIIIISYFTNKVIEISLFKQIKSMVPVLLITVISALPVIAISYIISSPILIIVAGSILYATVFFVLSKIFKFNEMSMIIGMIHRK